MKDAPDTSLNDLIRPEVDNLPRYNAGLALDRFREVYGIEAVAKLDSNENPAGPCAGAITAMQAAAAEVGRYPDATSTVLRQAIAGATGAEADRIVMGNGSEDLIGAVFRTVLRPGDRVVTVCPSFGLHEFGALACGASVTKVPFPADWAFPVDGLLAAMAKPVRVLIFSSPSNPAGPVIDEAGLRRLLAGTPAGTLVVFDEAYLEYMGEGVGFDALAVLADAVQPWIVLRTFSKAYGLAGARVGYGIASEPGLIAALMKVRNPFAVNGVAAAGALAALADRDHLARGVALAIAERDRVAAALRARGYGTAPTETNFVFFDTGGEAAPFAETLRRKGILIKPWQEEPFRNWARVTVGTAGQNDAFLAALPARQAG